MFISDRETYIGCKGTNFFSTAQNFSLIFRCQSQKKVQKRLFATKLHHKKATELAWVRDVSP
jgi:predicted 3-demethylubiquinone-9 3-methyltransferase (glyoxalase superfamily)